MRNNNVCQTIIYVRKVSLIEPFNPIAVVFYTRPVGCFVCGNDPRDAEAPLSRRRNPLSDHYIAHPLDTGNEGVHVKTEGLVCQLLGLHFDLRYYPAITLCDPV